MAISRRVVLYLIGALVLVHNTEEAVAFTRGWTLFRERVVEETGFRLSATPEPIYPALLLATIVPALIITWAARRPDRPVRLWFALLIQAVMRQERWLSRTASRLLVPAALLVHGPLLFGVFLATFNE